MTYASDQLLRFVPSLGYSSSVFMYELTAERATNARRYTRKAMLALGKKAVRSGELHQVDCGERSTGELLDLSAGLEVAEVDGGKSQLADQVRNRRLRIGVL